MFTFYIYWSRNLLIDKAEETDSQENYCWFLGCDFFTQILVIIKDAAPTVLGLKTCHFSASRK